MSCTAFRKKICSSNQFDHRHSVGASPERPMPCRAWRKKKLAARRMQEEEQRKERIRKGLLTGREIFMESQSAIQDDDTAAGDDDMLREVDEELEIAKMNAQAAEEQRRAREEVRNHWFLLVSCL